MRKLLKVDIQEKLVPVSATQGGVKGFRYKDTTTGQLVGGFVPVDQLTPAQTSEISKYIAPAGAKDFKGYQGYKLDPSALSASPGAQGPQAASPGPQGPQAAAPGPQGPQAAAPGPQGPQAAAPGPQGPQAAAPKPRPRPVPVKSRRQQELDAINADKTLSPREKWEKANPGLAAAQREREAIRGTSETDNPLMSGLRSAMPSPSTALDPKAFKADLAKSKIKPSAYSSLLDNPRRLKFTDSYDLVLDYLLSEGHADTVDEAHYVMMQLDSEYIQSIVESGYFPTPESQRADEAKYKLSTDELPGRHKPVKGKPPTKK
jgi:hypothetical protein